ncbi:uncharacterized protein CANTADRAFT_168310 [Suhomyces tanzawaensis NRRL Y-17324]|uniref:Uncharacterized protein n=1 Tax=Suhomyces tanzawaensis NRRL Y-17324 TaxID=984487 RepID=A0A1E4SMQ0_9ASCO|nr:uncharacterized protein CANTADRAFT_168310 [Suhomyces tanzawaensis NRRL Y-17324]ODV80662.1 hypothetical protein CANTADRAFT_168310 [Suhomyces tanzawaensis NRRL Y-17324]
MSLAPMSLYHVKVYSQISLAYDHPQFSSKRRCITYRRHYHHFYQYLPYLLQNPVNALRSLSSPVTCGPYYFSTRSPPRLLADTVTTRENTGQAHPWLQSPPGQVALANRSLRQPITGIRTAKSSLLPLTPPLLDPLLSLVPPVCRQRTEV